MAPPADMLWNSEPRTLLKHQVYRQYLRCWMGKICQRFPTSAIVDAFAGPGGYRDGPDGSPVVIAKTFLEHSGLQRFNQLRLICQEKRPDRRDELASRLASLPKAHRLDIKVPSAGELRDRFIALRSAAHGSDQKTPVLWILDPFDYSSAPFGLVRACLAGPRDEVLITWFADEIYRFCGDSSKEQAIDRHFGTQAWRQATVRAASMWSAPSPSRCQCTPASARRHSPSATPSRRTTPPPARSPSRRSPPSRAPATLSRQTTRPSRQPGSISNGNIQYPDSSRASECVNRR